MKVWVENTIYVSISYMVLSRHTLSEMTQKGWKQRMEKMYYTYSFQKADVGTHSNKTDSGEASAGI